MRRAKPERYEFDPDGAIIRVRPGDRSCLHRQTHIGERGREVTCQECGAVLDPFDELMRIARMEYVHERRRLAYAELAQLERKISNAKATLRRWEKKMKEAGI